MNSVARRGLLLCLVLAILVVVILYFVLGDRAVREPAGGTGRADTDSGELVRIEGDVVEPVSPGVMVSIDLRFTNPHDFPLSITDLSVAVRDVSAPNADESHSCSVEDFAVEQTPADLRIPLAAGGTSTLSSLGLPRVMWPRMGMVDRPLNQDGCKGASLRLSYAASGTEGNR
jgi:hypothetical protein